MTRARLVDKYESMFDMGPTNLLELTQFLYTLDGLDHGQMAREILKYFRKKQEEMRSDNILHLER